MNYQNLKYFLTVARTLNYTRAADILFVSQQTVTKQIARLEEELGVTLFERNTHHVRLTEAGRIAEHEFMTLNNDMAIALQKIRQVGGGFADEVSIGFFSMLPQESVIKPIMRLLSDAFPNVDFIAHLHSFDELRKRLFDCDIDLCVTLCWDRAFWTDINTIVLKTLPAEIFVSSKHPWAKRESVTVEDLASETIYSLDHNISVSHATGYEKTKAGKYVYLPNFESVLTNVASGKGFAMTCRLFEGGDSGDYAFFPLPHEERTTTEFVFAYNRNNNNKNLPAFAQLIQENRENIAR